MKKTLITILLIGAFLLIAQRQRLIEFRDLSNHVQESLPNTGRYYFDGAADDEQIADMLAGVADSLIIEFSEGVYSLNDTDADGFGISIKNRKYVYLRLTGALMKQESTVNSFMMLIDSCEHVEIEGGRWWGNMANQTSGGGIKIQNSNNVILTNVTSDSTWSHALSVFSCQNVKISNYNSTGSVAGRGIDLDWDVSGDTEGSNVLIDNAHIVGHGFNAIKIENHHNVRITNSTLVELSPGGGSIAALVLDNNDGAADTLQFASISNTYIEGAIKIIDPSGPVSLNNCDMNNTYISIEGDGHDTRIWGGYLYTKAVSHSRAIDADDAATGRLTIGGGIQIRGTGAVSRALEFGGNMKYVVDGAYIRDIGNRVFYISAIADSVSIKNVKAWSLGGHGANEMFADVYSGQNSFFGNEIYDFKRGIRFHDSDSNSVELNKFLDATSTADTAISMLGTSDDNRLIYNTYDNYTTDWAWATQGNNLSAMGVGEEVFNQMILPSDLWFQVGGQTSRKFRLRDDGSRSIISVDGSGTLYISENLAPDSDNSRWIGNASNKYKGAFWVIYTTDPGDEAGKVRAVDGTPDTLKIGNGYILFDGNDTSGGQ